MKATTGKYGEEVAARLVRWWGWAILEKNSHQRWSEFDLVCRDTAGMLVVVEVKTGKDPGRALSQPKIERLRTALHTKSQEVVRLDAVLVNTRTKKVVYLQDILS